MTLLYILVDNLCQNAHYYTNDQYIINIQDNWLLGTYCQWLISAKDEVGGYVTLEFSDIKVRVDRIDWNCLSKN